MLRLLRFTQQESLANLPAMIYRVVGAGTLALVFHAALVLVFCTTIFVLCVTCAVLDDCFAQPKKIPEPQASSTPRRRERVITIAGVPVPSLFTTIQQQQITKTGILAHIMKEPYSSPGQVSRSRKGTPTIARARVRHNSAPVENARPRLNTATLGRRVALAQLSGNTASDFNQNGFLAQSAPASGFFSKLSLRRPASSSPPRMFGKSLPPRLQNLAAATSRQEYFSSDMFLRGLPAHMRPLVPPGLSLQNDSIPLHLPQLNMASHPVNVFKQGTVNSQYTVAIPMDVFTQHLVSRAQASAPFAPTNPAPPMREAPQSPQVCPLALKPLLSEQHPQTPTPFKLRATSCEFSPTPAMRQAQRPVRETKSADSSVTATIERPTTPSRMSLSPSGSAVLNITRPGPTSPQRLGSHSPEWVIPALMGENQKKEPFHFGDGLNGRSQMHGRKASQGGRGIAGKERDAKRQGHAGAGARADYAEEDGVSVVRHNRRIRGKRGKENKARAQAQRELNAEVL
ncbi:hypothetical protein BXZ70DRAFT_941115 [Cristinia sonorae]|uniref:Uncharacterized protein n=1 Tax=Cristinia sonorae TaxID=1940300 RepID=A0A8K0UNA4_9AGAR|nr:hypothetical protein BXZ70DRAFT_941115 [Cristinia sonorae]